MRNTRNAVTVAFLFFFIINVPAWAGSLVTWGYDEDGLVSDTPTSCDIASVSAGGYHNVALKSDGSLVAWGYDNNGQVSDTPEGNDFIAVSAGNRHNVALRSDGSLAVWGFDGYGQVSDTPAGNDFIVISAGYGHNVALKNDGSLVAWGYDDYGQVSDTPVGNDFVVVSAGYLHSVALKSDGSLVAWGNDDYEQVSNTPEDNDFLIVGAGGFHNVAIRSDGSLVAWGLDAYGQVSDTPTGSDFAAISVGDYHSVALKSEGSLVAWGYDYYGQVSDTPAGSDFIAISAGDYHNVAIIYKVTDPTFLPVERKFSNSVDVTIACSTEEAQIKYTLDGTTPSSTVGTIYDGTPIHLTETTTIRAIAYKEDLIDSNVSIAQFKKTQAGALVAWGEDDYGQVSDIPAGRDFEAVSVGHSHSVALKTDGSLAAWGRDNYNQVGDTPTGNDFAAIAAGYYHNVALKSDGSLVAWGYDYQDQVSNTPAGNDFTAISAGDFHNVALKSDGSLVSWGHDYFSQVSDTPSGNDFIAVSAGAFHSVALKSDGSLVSWGNDEQGQVSDTPAGNGFVAVSAGYYHSMALKSDRSIVCWGNDNYGQVSNTPAGNDFVAITAGYFHNVALKSDGSLVAWGQDHYGQVSDTPSDSYFVAISAGGYYNVAIIDNIVADPAFLPVGRTFIDSVDVSIVCATEEAEIRYTLDGNTPSSISGTIYDGTPIHLTETTTIKAIAYKDGMIASDVSIAQFRRMLAGSLVAWGRDNYHQVSNTPAGNDFATVSAGGYHSVALKSNSSLMAWGYDYYGQVSDTPAGNDFAAVTAGDRHNVALRSDGSLVAWGWDNYGQVSDTPAGNDFAAIAAGYYHNVALKSDGSLAAWGFDYYGQVSDTPEGNDFVDVEAGYCHNVALKSEGSLAAWGNDDHSQVSGTPSGNDFVAVSAGYYHNVALKSDGSLVAWGLDESGQVSGTPEGNDFIAVEAGYHHNVALKSDGSLVSWGYDSYGQVSDTPAGSDFIAVEAGYYHNVAIRTSDDPTVSSTVAFESDESSGDESEGLVSLTVNLSKAYSGTVEVDYSVTGGTATSSDYILVSGTLEFLSGEMTQDILIKVLDDLTDEYDETIIVTLSNPVNATLGTSVQTYTITDNDDPPGVEFVLSSSFAIEAPIPATLPVELAAASGKTVTVDYSVTGGTATGGGVDYTLSSGTLTFSPGDTSENITVTIVDDPYGEADETIIVTLSNPANATIATIDSHTYTIENDDPSSIEFLESSSSGPESASSVSIGVRLLPELPDHTATVDYAVSGGTATGGNVDYILDSGTLTFSPGETSENIIISVVNDSEEESNETIIITLSNPTNATTGANDSYTYTIINDDDSTDPYLYGQIPTPNSIQVARDTIIKLHIADEMIASTSGVNIETVQIQLEGTVIYNDAEAGPDGIYNSEYGICKRLGSEADYTFIFLSSTLFDYEQEIDITVNAADTAGNIMPEENYKFYTVMRSFGKNIRVNSDTGSLVQDHPATAKDSDGNIWVVWDQTTAAGDTDIYIGKLGTDSSSFGASAAIHSDPSVQSHPVVAIDSGDILYVAWQGQSAGSPWDIYISRSGDGTTWSDPVVVNVEDPNNESNQTKPSIAIDILDLHTIYIAYEDDRAGNSDIWIASSIDGTDWTETQITSNTSEQTDPVVCASDPFDTGYVLWTDARNSTGGNQLDIYGAGPSDGWTERQVVAGAANQYKPATTGYDIAHILWIEDTGSFSDVVYGNDESGLPIVGIGITDEPNIIVSDPAIALRYTDISTKVFAVWTDGRNISGNSDTDIYFAEYGSDFGTNILVNDDLGTSSQSNPVVNVDIRSNPYIVWVDQRNGNKDIYYAGTTYISKPLSKTIFTDGGTTIVQTVDNIKVTIPAGALPDGFDANDITIAESHNLPELPEGVFGACYNLGPSGLQFNAPVTITIPHNASDCPGLPIYVAYWYNPQTDTWSQDGITNVQHQEISSTTHSVSFQTTHFTIFSIGAYATGGGGGGGGGGCAMSQCPSSRDDIGGFFLPYIVYIVILLSMGWADARKRKIKSEKK